MNLVFALPVGCGSKASSQIKRPPLAPVWAYTAGCAVGGGVTGALLGALGMFAASISIPGGPSLALAALALLVLVATRAAIRGSVAPLPQRQAQVPRGWILRNSRIASAAAFGLMIGSGVLTYLHHACAYTGAAVVILTVSPATGALLGALYGSTRGGMLVLAWIGRAGNPASARGRLFVRLGRLGGALTALSVLAFVVAVTRHVY
jgi:hypothetical protein